MLDELGLVVFFSPLVDLLLHNDLVLFAVHFFALLVLEMRLRQIQAFVVLAADAAAQLRTRDFLLETLAVVFLAFRVLAFAALHVQNLTVNFLILAGKRVFVDDLHLVDHELPYLLVLRVVEAVDALALRGAVGLVVEAEAVQLQTFCLGTLADEF